MKMGNERFIAGLEQSNREMVRSVPKSDLHCHSGLGFRLEVLERWAERKITPPPLLMGSLAEMNNWIVEELGELYSKRHCFEFAVKASLAEAWNDGITLLEMSVDLSFIIHYNMKPEPFGQIIKEAHRVVASEITFRPELGIARDMDPKEAIPLAMACIDTGHFSAIDLYGTEEAQPPEVYKALFRHARDKGLKCKAHAGEFGDAESVRHTAGILELDAVQHGIAAAESEEVMRWLADNNISLNICPTSNVRLSRVSGMKNHPVRQLFDAGVSVTVNSDDIMVFGQNVSDEYLNLFKAGTMTASELNVIRLEGLNTKS